MRQGVTKFARFSTARQGFGSFHSEDIEHLVRQPVNGIESSHAFIKEQSQLKAQAIFNQISSYFGKDLLPAVFSLEKNWAFLNHGAFGGAVVPAQYESALWRELCDRQPLRFFDRILLPTIAYNLHTVAAFLNCPASELLPLPNVTTGLNSIVNSVPLSLGDEVLCFSITYGSTKKILKSACVRSGAKLVIVDMPLPILSPDDVLKRVQCSLSTRTKLVIIDSITSNTALTLPVVALGRLCKAVGALVVVDAAHSLFSQSVSIYGPAVDPPASEALAHATDVWLTNGHKWLSCSRGCAFMWVSPRLAGRLRPAIVSHGFTAAQTSGGVELPYADKAKTTSAFAWDGCRDYAAFLSVSSVLSFWEEFDKRAMACSAMGSRQYMSSLLARATEELKHSWSIDESRFAGPSEMRSGSPMCLVPLPQRVRGVNTTRGCTDDNAFQLQELLHHEYAIEVPIKCLEGVLYTRISAHVYNHIDEYRRLSKVLLELR